MNEYVAYYRVSTQKQNLSHLGMEAQRKMCNDFVTAKSGVIVKEFEDVESGKSQTRQGLWSAIEFCKTNNMPLVIAKLDRLARCVEFTFKVINTGVEIYFTDMPMVNTMILGVFASVAQYERELISSRTKQALQAKKARGETWHRNSDTTKASRVSADNRIEDARNDQANLFFYKYWKAYAERNADKEKNKAYYQQLADELNALGQRTCKGLEYTAQIVQNRIVRMRQLYEGVERKKRTITA